jgi:hypothetical protein
MQFGLKTAPPMFQAMMNSALSGLIGSQCFVFLDDMVIFAKSLAKHDVKLREEFSKFRKYNLKLQPDKCEFLQKEVNCFGHLITEKGCRPDPIMIDVIENFPRPKNENVLKSFLGMISYYRFIPRFGKKAAPMHALLKRTILQYPDFTKEFILTTDASSQGLGALLSRGEIGKDLPIPYPSRNLNNAEKNYATSKKELLAIVWGVKHSRPYLHGRKVKMASGHKPFTWIVNERDPGSRLIRSARELRL